MNRPLHSNEFLLIKEAQAKKLRSKSKGMLSYQLLIEPDRSNLWIRITGNEGRGYFNDHPMSCQSISSLISTQNQEKGFSAKLLNSITSGRSTNNAYFLAAILINEGVIKPDPNGGPLLFLTENVSQWLSSQLSGNGTTIILEPKVKSKALSTSKEAISKPISHHSKRNKQP
ncbi:hypothetical protein KSF73_01340 [Burkholderiaceae bacterium DAT-1]|nr:hypothetical protein [Burkholderiaceae bacterium DAT-1]